MNRNNCHRFIAAGFALAVVPACANEGRGQLPHAALSESAPADHPADPAGPADRPARSDRRDFLARRCRLWPRHLFSTPIAIIVDSQDAARCRRRRRYYRALLRSVTFTIPTGTPRTAARAIQPRAGRTPRQFGQEFPGQPRRRMRTDFPLCDYGKERRWALGSNEAHMGAEPRAASVIINCDQPEAGRVQARACYFSLGR